MLSVCVCGLGEGGRDGKEATLSKLFRLRFKVYSGSQVYKNMQTARES